MLHLKASSVFEFKRMVPRAKREFAILGQTLRIHPLLSDD
jgi:hypothetical protein